MGSLFEAAAGGATPPKRIPHLRPSAPATSSLHRLTRFLLSDKVGYLHWVFTVAAFLFVVALFQAFLPGSPDEGPDGGTGSPHLGEIGRLEFGDGIRFVPSKLLERWERERREANLSAIEGFAGRSRRTYGLRKPLLALVVPNLFPDAMQLQTISIAVVLKEIGYDIQIFSFEDGPVESVWSTIGLSVRILPTTTIQETTVDWLNYDGILVNSMISKPVISCLLQEPFRNVPVIWTINEKFLAFHLRKYGENGQVKVWNEWKQIFSRASVIVFSTHIMPMMYSSLDAGNFMVIPGCPTEAWEADNLVTWKEHNEPKIGYTQEDFVIAIVGGEFSYSGLLLEHALILEAIKPLLQQFKHVNSSLRICILNANLTTVHRNILEAIARNGGFSSIIMENIVADGNMNDFINAADIVLYGSFLEEQSIPTVLIRAMSLGKLVVAPDLSMISKYVDNGVNAYLFPKDKVGMVSKILLEVVSNGKLSPLAQQVASLGKERARNLMASETILGYVSLLEKVLNYPSEIAIPKPVDEIPIRLQKEWQWDLFVNVRTISNLNLSIRSYQMLEGLEEPLNHGSFGNTSADADKIFSSIVWEDEKEIEMVIAKIRIQEEELKDRTDQPHGTWDEVYRSVKRADRARNELHERDDRELERTGQPLCIYEPYFGQGAWPFLRRTSLYRGIGLSSKGRRPGADDIDASSRLPLLSDSYYRDVLGEYGAFFALGYHIDRVHKNAWIGFQSWRASAKKLSLSKEAETKLLKAIQTQRHGDAFYFWVGMDKDPRNSQQMAFWDFCDAINAGNCRFAVAEILRKMYGIQADWNSLPQMPNDGDSWSVTNSWVLPTRSFLEFVMFSRMFVDVMDRMIYDEHRTSGHCFLSISKDGHCYSRLLELLVNVWAYHSARRMVYVNPESGAMEEQHRLKNRRGQMWIKWFSYATLKSMDEDLAEEADSDRPSRRWLWPSTGEVVWQGVYERERNMRHKQKERRKQQSRDKIQRIKKRARQKTLGKYIKPSPDDVVDSNTTEVR
ncbi:uncharacterized protein LOC121996343 isoform X2 [Zingiber officinale]|uniref:uncharacterized protein LOC121996343 isoform X2 n=1 Tax=Zingiber officinale TaxID=94328 RepID=UPI001C4CA68D|nr:uncharacterized protein LOC121996343 isoform X2 [Zingiber officinale]